MMLTDDKTLTGKVVQDAKTLRERHPELWAGVENKAELWDHPYGSDKLISWKCVACKNTWMGSSKNRIHGTKEISNCPKCNRKASGLRMRKLNILKWVSDNAEVANERPERTEGIPSLIESEKLLENILPYIVDSTRSTILDRTSLDSLLENLSWLCWTCRNPIPGRVELRSILLGIKACKTCSNGGHFRSNRINKLFYEYSGLDRGKELFFNPNTAKSKEISNWECNRGHKWTSSLISRLATGSNCTECQKERTLQLAKSDWNSRYKNLMEEYSTSTFNSKPLSGFLPSSSRLAEWQCGQGHIWKATISNRARKLSGCRRCSIRTSRLSDYPAVVEWLDVICLQANPEDLFPSSLELMMWRCPTCSHSFSRRIKSMTDASTISCPSTSCSAHLRPEKSNGSIIEGKYRDTIFERGILQLDPVFELGSARLGFGWNVQKVTAVDIYGISRGREVCTEYDGAYWHGLGSSFEDDIKKSWAILNQGMILVRLREEGLPSLKIDHPNYAEFTSRTRQGIVDTKALDEMNEWLNP